MICVILQRYIGQNAVPFEAKQEVIQVISAPDMTQNATKFHAISSRFSMISSIRLIVKILANRLKTRVFPSRKLRVQNNSSI